MPNAGARGLHAPRPQAKPRADRRVVQTAEEFEAQHIHLLRRARVFAEEFVEQAALGAATAWRAGAAWSRSSETTGRCA